MSTTPPTAEDLDEFLKAHEDDVDRLAVGDLEGLKALVWALPEWERAHR